MDKDPYCGVYFTRRDGVDLKIDGQDLYFCSQECRDKFCEKTIQKNSSQPAIIKIHRIKKRFLRQRQQDKN